MKEKLKTLSVKNIQIGPEAHKKIKIYCTQNDILMRDFCETALNEALEKRKKVNGKKNQVKAEE